MKKFTLLISGALALMGNTVFAAEQKELLTLEYMPDTMKLEIIKQLIDEKPDFESAVEALRELRLTSKELEKSITALVPDLSSYIKEKFFNNDKNKAQNELLRLVGSEKLSPLALTILNRAGADINDQKRVNNDTLLIITARMGEIKMVNELIAAGADLNRQNRDGNTALMEAALEGRPKIVQILIEKKADLNKQDINGWTALMNAIPKGDIEIIKMLIDANADLTMKNKSGNTALNLAEIFGHTKIVTMLKEAIKKQNQNKG